ncbi:DUF6503 family protein [uncultured Olleya sp.]|uniref:DUF6503 family protein n=1 Tax=uncultured Olleya sp. TaxID=757243 RepID=UPI00259657EA|nr:DUF6503 family protein [uncultured Olleya sp.]
MKSFYILAFILTSTSITIAQQISGPQLLDKAIQYHDPQGHWSTFNDTLNITMTMPESNARNSQIVINLPKEYFSVTAKKDTVTTQYTIIKDSCTISLNGNKKLTNKQLKSNNLSCDRATLYKNYYTYLYGLPMKLKDKGTIISPEAKTVNFKGKTYLQLQVNYNAEVGKDVWYFYFNPKTYAMEMYQFYKTDSIGQVDTNTGEYIILNDIKTVNGIKTPKIRTWYYNKDDKYLATDNLN